MLIARYIHTHSNTFADTCACTYVCQITSQLIPPNPLTCISPSKISKFPRKNPRQTCGIGLGVLIGLAYLPKTTSQCTCSRAALAPRPIRSRAEGGATLLLLARHFFGTGNPTDTTPICCLVIMTLFQVLTLSRNVRESAEQSEADSSDRLCAGGNSNFIMVPEWQ